MFRSALYFLEVPSKANIGLYFSVYMNVEHSMHKKIDFTERDVL